MHSETNVMKHLQKQGAEEDQDWKSRDDEPRMSRLRQRRGRSIVHRSLEDNYGAVVVANHEALAQFLEQVHQVIIILCGSTRVNYFQSIFCILKVLNFLIQHKCPKDIPETSERYPTIAF